VEEVTDEPLYRDRVCGIDIGKAGLAATIRVPSEANPARRAAETRSFGTTRPEVLALADWLRSWQVPAVVMEATGDYWKGPFCRLEAEGFECVLADARQVKNLPGRPKRDLSDSRWLAACFERGAVTSCFVATPGFRVIRLHTRYRRDLTEERTREKQRAEKLLESAAIKLSSVLTDLHGVTGRDIMDHLIAGQRDPQALAQLARAAARRKIAELEAALDGAEFFTAGHPALLAAMLARIDRVERRLLTAVRAGGHSIAGYGVCDDALMLDLSLMRGVWVDPGARTVRVQGGATWGDVDRETQVFGLAVPGGVVSTTGVAGLTLGGGIGWLHRAYGLACDHLRSVEIVTADGQLRRASEAENPDLFWAVRGGGGNFGVVTTFEFTAHPLGPVVPVAAVMYPSRTPVSCSGPGGRGRPPLPTKP
jgi:transposase